ncbi:MAG: glycoside hydrolase family 88 protein [Chitinophagaceae bacterium]
MKKLPSLLLVIFLEASCKNAALEPDLGLKYVTAQASKTAVYSKNYKKMPRTINLGDSTWQYVSIEDWTSGFWPGVLWYVYEYTKDSIWKNRADSFTQSLQPLAFRPASDHDLGFQVNCSYGNGYRLTKDPSYKKILLAAADTLATLFNPRVGTLLSWPAKVKEEDWQHNTIIDNMMNLELLFWASKNGDSKKLYDIAVKHAETTMHNHFRPDFSSCHVVVYDTVSGKMIKRVTHQGYRDNSMWARGQAWAIYGFTMCYRETKKPEFLDFAQQVAYVYLNRLPDDLVPFWDFSAPGIPDAPKDASAAAITASALLELSTFVADKNKAADYRSKAEQMLTILSSDVYQSKQANKAFLLHSTGNEPNGTEIDASIIYADYYYIEALLRAKKLKEGKSIYSNL